MIWRSLTCFSLLAAAVYTTVSLAGQTSCHRVRHRGTRQLAHRVSRTRQGLFGRCDFVACDRSSGARCSREALSHAPEEQDVHAAYSAGVAGTTIDFPNGDPIFHSAFSTYGGQIFDLGLYAPGTSRSVRFRRPGIVRVFCNIHPSMSAVILVLSTPYFVVTQRDGSFRLDVPPGSYDMDVFHERATDQVLRSLSRRIVVEPAGIRIPPIIVSETGYLIVPHKNKFGKDYDVAPDDQTLYQGAGR